MSVQFGVWQVDGAGVEPTHLETVDSLLAAYGPDGMGSFDGENIAIRYYAFHTTRESVHESQPYVSRNNTIIVWDGRLDNREDLIGQLHWNPAENDTDVAIIAACYERWGDNCFAKLLGDWAVSIWNAVERKLTLARDFIGARPLYYATNHHRALWCTVLEPLVVLGKGNLQLNREFIKAWLSPFPAVHSTPYIGIHSVPPRFFASIKAGSCTLTKYWDFSPAERLVYRDSRIYEEHFREIFATSVRRRLRSHVPIAAELSGGIDSSSIVCMADHLLAIGSGGTPRLDTISYFDNQEPNWNELPFLEIIEKRRGTAGAHLDMSRYQGLYSLDPDHFFALPGYSNQGVEVERDKLVCLKSNGNRVLLSGIGGDEFLGGVPSPIPELADLLVAGNLLRFFGQLTEWSRAKKRPALALLRDTLREVLTLSLCRTQSAPLPRWFIWRCEDQLRFKSDLPSKRLPFGKIRPSFWTGQQTLDVLRGRMRMVCLPWLGMYETRYPFLDRDLIEFSLSIPCEQLRRPGQRRSLMRRALADLVPAEVLGRRRKGYITRRPLDCIAKNWEEIRSLICPSGLAALGYVDQRLYCEAFLQARKGLTTDLVLLLRALKLELWLRNLSINGVITDDIPAARSRAAIPA